MEEVADWTVLLLRVWVGTDRCNQVNYLLIGDCGLGMLSYAIGVEFQSLSKPDPVSLVIIQHHTYDYDVLRSKKLGRLPFIPLLIIR